MKYSFIIKLREVVIKMANEKDMIVEGTIIQQRDGVYWAYVEYNGNQVLMNEEEYYPLRAINEDLTHSISFERDIIAIWEVNASNPLQAIEYVRMDAYCKKIYDRPTIGEDKRISLSLNEWELLKFKELLTKELEIKFDLPARNKELLTKLEAIYDAALFDSEMNLVAGLFKKR